MSGKINRALVIYNFIPCILTIYSIYILEIQHYTLYFIRITNLYPSYVKPRIKVIILLKHPLVFKMLNLVQIILFVVVKIQPIFQSPNQKTWTCYTIQARPKLFGPHSKIVTNTSHYDPYWLGLGAIWIVISELPFQDGYFKMTNFQIVIYFTIIWTSIIWKFKLLHWFISKWSFQKISHHHFQNGQNGNPNGPLLKNGSLAYLSYSNGVQPT